MCQPNQDEQCKHHWLLDKRNEGACKLCGTEYVSVPRVFGRAAYSNSANVTVPHAVVSRYISENQDDIYRAQEVVRQSEDSRRLRDNR